MNCSAVGTAKEKNGKFLCFICEEGGEEEKVAKVTEKGYPALEKVTSDSGNTAALERLQEAWEKKELAYHYSCKRNTYNMSRDMSTKLKQEEDREKEDVRRKKRRKSTTDSQETVSTNTERVFLPYKGKCILCNELVSLYANNPELARKHYSQPDNLTAHTLKTRLLKTAEDRLENNPNDKWALEVKGRLLGINDLVAEEAYLHKRCNTMFSAGRSCNLGGMGELHAGRKTDDERAALFDDLCSWLENKIENHSLTLDQVHQKLQELDGTAEKSLAYSKRYLKTKLLEKYSDKLYFTSQERRADVLCLKDTSASIIREYHDSGNEADEKTKIINTAVKLIQNDISLVNLDTTTYPSVHSMTDLETQLSLIPESLKLLLTPLLKTEKKVAAWGQNIIKTCRPRSGILPFPLGFAIQLDHKFGSKWLLDELHSLGYCDGYWEVSNYKYCYLRSKYKSNVKSSSLNTIIEETNEEVDENAVEAELQTMLDNDVTLSSDEPGTDKEQLTNKPVTYVERPVLANQGEQFVGDNIDLNIVSINGNTSFHAMGLIKVTSRSTAVNDDYLDSKIPRLKLSTNEKAEILKAGDITIKPCSDPKKSGLNSITLLPFKELLDSVSKNPPTPSPGDTLWAAGWILKIKDAEFSHANWNGWMKSIHKDKVEQTTYVDYQPVIDGTPSDYSTIYTTLLQCVHLSKTQIPVITFDFPLWIKAVDIILNKKLIAIARLGGFHLLKSYLGTFGVIFADSGLYELIQLIYPGTTVVDSILNGGSFDKAIRAHLLIDAAIFQHVLSYDAFTDAELNEMKKLIERMQDEKLGADWHDSPLVGLFQSRMDEAFARLAKSGRTPALWVLYHYMVDTIKIFIKAERLGDFSLHLSCIAHRMLHIFAAAGHHHYAKGARLYVQMMMEYEKGSPEQAAVINSFKSGGSHVIRYSSHEWSGIWSDLCIEQTLMRAAKSDGGLTGGRYRNGESAHRCWVQTLSHMSLINEFMESSKTKHRVLHRDLAAAQKVKDIKSVLLIRGWLGEMQPFDEGREKNVLVAFSTGFLSTEGDKVNADKAINVGKAIHTKIDGEVSTTTFETKNKVQSLAILRKNTTANQANRQLNSLKLFNRLVIFAQREANIESSLEYELTPIPLSLFSDKDQMMHEANKASFSQTCLKDRVNPVDIQPSRCPSIIIDGGWLLHIPKWEKGQTWADIVHSYVQYAKFLGKHAENILVVFDGYNNSTKDHTHQRREKLSCPDMKIRSDITPLTTKPKFLSNRRNKTEFISLLTDAMLMANINVVRCTDDADTTVVKFALDYAEVHPVEVRAEDTDILVMLVHHHNVQKHKQIIFATSKDNYSVGDIAKALSDKQKRYLLMCHAFTGCDTVSSIFGFSKEKLFERLCKGKIGKQLDIFYDPLATQDDIQVAGIKIFQCIYRSLGTPLATTRFHQFSRQAKVGVIRPEKLPPTTSSAALHSLRAYLQLQDWLVLKSMSRDPTLYGWSLDARGYEPVTNREPIAPANLLKFLSCGCSGDCTSQRCSCRKNNAKCISVCENCHGTSCKNNDVQDRSRVGMEGEI